jgi:hypothetical protein
MADDLVHMKQDRADADKPMNDLNSNKEEYPYGLCLNLGEAELKKLGIEMPKIGEMVHIMAMCKVTHCHASASENSDPSSSCSLQITHMKAEIEDAEDEDDIDTRTPAEKIYGKK